jgi:hypothetical protein
MIFVGDDWAEDHHNVYATAADGAHLKFVVNGVTNIAQSLHRNAGPATLIQAPEQPRPVHDDHHPRHGLGRVAKNPAQRCFEMFRSRVPSPLLGSAVHGCCSVESARRFGLGEHLDLVATSTRASVLYFAKFLINNIQIHT